MKAERLILRPRWYDCLPARVQNVLHNAGLTALPEAEAANAVARLSRRELLAARNIGRAAADAIAAWLADHGLMLRSLPTKKGTLERERPSDSKETDPLPTGRNEDETTCPYTRNRT